MGMRGKRVMLRLLLGDRICHASMSIASSMWLFMNLKEHVLSSSDLSWGHQPPNPGGLGGNPQEDTPRSALSCSDVLGKKSLPYLDSGW